MELNDKLDALAEVFDCDVSELRPDRKLEELDWDSMMTLSVIALMKAQYNKKITGAEIRAFTTVQDILNVMG